MIIEKYLAPEFIRAVDLLNPQVGELLSHCYLKVVDSYSEQFRKRFYHIAIYCPEAIVARLLERKYVLKEIAENMGLVEVVCLNATRLLHDPMSRLKQEDPRLWLELHWIATQPQQ
jgi:hypothetical protein